MGNLCVFMYHGGVRRIEQQNPFVFVLMVVCYREDKERKKERRVIIFFKVTSVDSYFGA